MKHRKANSKVPEREELERKLEALQRDDLPATSIILDSRKQYSSQQVLHMKMSMLRAAGPTIVSRLPKRCIRAGKERLRLANRR
jgi:hypothetical protein